MALASTYAKEYRPIFLIRKALEHKVPVAEHVAVWPNASHPTITSRTSKVSQRCRNKFTVSLVRISHHGQSHMEIIITDGR